jgi:hypothetical protein
MPQSPTNSWIERCCRIEGHPLGGEQIEAVERGDDLAADEQFFQRLTIAQLFLGQKVLPNGGGQRDSNPQQPEPQSGALPLSYGHRRAGL